MARGKSKVNAREARREQALQSIVDSMIGPYGDFVREQLQDVSQRLRAARAAQAAPPPGAGAPGAFPFAAPGRPGGPPPPSPVPPPTVYEPPEGPYGTGNQLIPNWSDIPGAGLMPPNFNLQGNVNQIPDPGFPIPAPFNPYMPIFEDNSQMPTDPSFVAPIPPPMFGGASGMPPGYAAAQILRELQMRMNAPQVPVMPPGQRF